MNTSINDSVAIGLGSDLATRNLACGAAGLIFNVAAIAYLVVSRTFKRSLKALLVSLTFSDLGLMCSLILYGSMNWTGISEEPLCWPIMVTICTTITVMYCTTAQLALYNYVAVYHPHRFKAWTTVKRVVAANICTWALAITICILTVSLPAKTACLPILGISETKSIPMCTVWNGSSTLVIVLNTAVLLKLRKRSRTVTIAAPKRVLSTMPTESTVAPMTVSSVIVPTITRRFDPQSRSAPIPISALPVAAKFRSRSCDCERPGTSVPIPMSALGLALSKAPGTEHQHIQIQAISSEAHGRAAFSNLNRSLSTTDMARSSIHRHFMDKQNCQGTVRSKESCMPNMSTTGTSRSGEETERVFEADDSGNRSLGTRKRKTNFTLSLLTFWCCFLSMPFAVYIVWLAHLPEVERRVYALAPAGMIGSSLIIASSIGNPFLYAWRFLNWSRVFSRLKEILSK